MLALQKERSARRQKLWQVFVGSVSFFSVSLNFENSYPEFNSLDNWKKIGGSLLSKPIQLKLLKDLNDPYYHQLFAQPQVKYNFYDGLLVGIGCFVRQSIDWDDHGVC